MNTNDLYLEYARVIQMCKNTELEDTPWVCVKLDGAALRYNYGHPGLSASIEKYEFAVAVLEGRPVFVGDTLWIKDGHGFTVEDDLHIDHRIMSWTPPTPKRTFTLNGAELPCPVNDGIELSHMAISVSGDTEMFFFKSKDDLDSVMTAMKNLLTEARDK